MAADPDADWVDTLADDDALLTGEAVALDLRPASFALRAGGAVIDVAISVLAFVVLIMAFFIPAGQLQLEAAWGTHKAALQTQDLTADRAAALLQADAQVLALAHQGTTQYEAASGKPLGHLVNVAGRQRMLSQRMAKFYLAAMLPVDAAAATAEIAKARAEFVAATELLRNAPQATSRIRQELQLADSQWVFFDAALQRMQGGGNVNRQVAEVYVASENLLVSMDRVTGMYAALAA